ncbi:HD domain-containing phosphohydrolase [Ammonifex thiophilus]|uniref:HD domain-containing protein n=1 Tax=Ammonifex thiophilus TaxID=444093 RepID=A0A3D8P4E2_9THEO|nr:HD domain-containing protein [Ammonifex thiophilus]RDV84009.1 HD domain-containing protein [Ammonifex thiophilus]
MGRSVDLVWLLSNLSLALDFSHRGLLRHHQRVALLSLRLAEAARMTPDDKIALFKAAIIHDLGVVSWAEKNRLDTFDVQDPWPHCRRGYELVGKVEILQEAAELILHHHDRWLGGNPSGKKGAEIPLGSRIIHLADRVSVLLTKEEWTEQEILNHKDRIIREIELQAGRLFDPELVCLLREVARNESLWFDLTSPFLSDSLRLWAGGEFLLSPDQLRAVAELFARVVDAKSPFTYLHSKRVAVVARFLAEYLGMKEGDLFLIELAGLLHDLGKLAVPDEVLEKAGPLSEAEFNLIKTHPYYTYWLLKPLDGQLPLVRWAAYHHEKLNGQGYPFRLTGAELCLGARVMAVSDIFTALREDRPYRASLSWEKAMRIIADQAEQGLLDRRVVEALRDSRRELEELWLEVS